MAFNFFTSLLLVCGVVYCSATECSVKTTMDCTQHLSAISTVEQGVDDKSFSRSAMKICDILDKATQCLASCDLPDSVGEIIQHLQKQKEMCDLATFMKHSQVYKDNAACINGSLTDAFGCIRDAYIVNTVDKGSLEKSCCAMETKMFCFEKKLPKTCDGKTMQYDFIDELRNKLHTECAKTLCSSANSLFFPAILPVFILSVVFGRFL